MKSLLILVALALLLSAARSLLPEGGDLYGVARTELAFGFVLLGAFFVSRIAGRFGLPKLVGYILAGVIFGPYGLGLVPTKMIAELELVNGVAICLIALTAGGELNFQRVRPLLRTIGALTAWGVVGTAIVLATALYAASSTLPFLRDLETPVLISACVMLGVVLSAQSPAVVMALLNETRAEGPLSRTILGTVVIGDLVVIMLFGFASSVVHATMSGDADIGRAAFGIAIEVFGSIGAGLVVGGLLTVYLRKVYQGVEPFVLLLCVVVAEIGSRIHLDPLIVMLTAGIVVANLSPRQAPGLIHDLEAVSLPVYIVFFALAGATLHLEVLADLGFVALCAVAIRAVLLWFFGRLATAATNAPEVVRTWAWAGLLPQAGLALALALLVERDFGEFGRAASTLLLGVITINELLMPVLLKHALVRSGEATLTAGVRRRPQRA